MLRKYVCIIVWQLLYHLHISTPPSPPPPPASHPGTNDNDGNDNIVLFIVIFVSSSSSCSSSSVDDDGDSNNEWHSETLTKAADCTPIHLLTCCLYIGSWKQRYCENCWSLMLCACRMVCLKWSACALLCGPKARIYVSCVDHSTSNPVWKPVALTALAGSG